MPWSPYHCGSPDTDGSAPNAPRGCLSSPTPTAISASPSATSRAASVSSEFPVAQPLNVARAGNPVMPTRPVIASGLATSRLPA